MKERRINRKIQFKFYSIAQHLCSTNAHKYGDERIRRKKNNLNQIQSRVRKSESRMFSNTQLCTEQYGKKDRSMIWLKIV